MRQEKVSVIRDSKGEREERMLKTILLLLFGVTLLGGMGVMALGHRINNRKGTKRYHPGNGYVNVGLVVIILSGLALAMLASQGFPS